MLMDKCKIIVELDAAIGLSVSVPSEERAIGPPVDLVLGLLPSSVPQQLGGWGGGGGGLMCFANCFLRAVGRCSQSLAPRLPS